MSTVAKSITCVCEKCGCCKELSAWDIDSFCCGEIRRAQRDDDEIVDGRLVPPPMPPVLNFTKYPKGRANELRHIRALLLKAYECFYWLDAQYLKDWGYHHYLSRDHVRAVWTEFLFNAAKIENGHAFVDERACDLFKAERAAGDEFGIREWPDPDKRGISRRMFWRHMTMAAQIMHVMEYGNKDCNC